MTPTKTVSREDVENAINAVEWIAEYRERNSGIGNANLTSAESAHWDQCIALIDQLRKDSPELVSAACDFVSRAE